MAHEDIDEFVVRIFSMPRVAVCCREPLARRPPDDDVGPSKVVCRGFCVLQGRSLSQVYGPDILRRSGLWCSSDDAIKSAVIAPERLNINRMDFCRVDDPESALRASTEEETEPHAAGASKQFDHVQRLRCVAQRPLGARTTISDALNPREMCAGVLPACLGDVRARGDGGSRTRGADSAPFPLFAASASQSGAYPPCVCDQLNEARNR